MGLVSLVGAGPGDPGLLTIKALLRLRQADLIVYDYLANPAHLRHSKKSAIKIGVGKGFRHKAMSQDKINDLIVSSARKGQHVVRLKGGDPYLFGRGGEEALYLEKHKIPFEVVPGVTSATACAAYAGIPLTHRDHNASVTFLTGHRADDSNLDTIPWKKIASLDGTLVIYMGFYNLAKITSQLIAAGMPESTPVAVIEWGTLPNQKTATGTVKNIFSTVKSKKLSAPCMIIIGDVVSLSKKLAWFEKLPLFGKKIVVARAEDKAGSFSAKLQDLGAEAITLPLIRIEKPDNFYLMDQALKKIGDFDWLVFSSAYGVSSFFDRLAFLGLDSRALHGVKIASVGSKTSALLASHGIQADLEPHFFNSKALALSLKKTEGSLRGKKILLLRTDIAPVDFENQLKKSGAETSQVTAYKTTKPKNISPETKNRILKGEADYMAFTSASTVNNFIELFGKKAVATIARKTHFLSIGPMTTKALKYHHLKPYVEAKISTIDGLIEALLKKGKK